jgi:spectinomycin phosphotransferase
MREPPEHLDPAELLTVIRSRWAPGIDRLEHLPIGFGAHHWAAREQGVRKLFVTYDVLPSHHTAASLEGAYAAAADLAHQGLEFVLAPLPSGSGTYTVAMPGGAVSITPWQDGTSGDGPHRDLGAAAASAGRLARLHATATSVAVPRWTPLVEPDLADRLDELTADTWASGPYGERTRTAVRERLDDLARWTARYHDLVNVMDESAWVLTHGEPHTRNELHTSDGVLLVDWESLQLAPRERDFATLLESGPAWYPAYGGAGSGWTPDWEMAELFDLQWRLSEVAGYAEWFAAPHTGNENDRISLGGLLGELDRPEWRPPA